MPEGELVEKEDTYDNITPKNRIFYTVFNKSSDLALFLTKAVTLPQSQ